MKHFLLVLGTFFSLSMFAQQNLDPNAPFQKDKNLPAFSLTTVQGKEVTQKDIPASYKNVVILIFSPDCSHCQHEAEELNKSADKLKNVYFIWDSYKDIAAIKQFAEKYQLDKQANVMIGRDVNFTLPVFFRPRMTPFVAVYQNNKLIRIYEQGADVPQLIKLFESK
jgi:thiol-disulfide isomerase/thioredoxin